MIPDGMQGGRMSGPHLPAVGTNAEGHQTHQEGASSYRRRMNPRRQGATEALLMRACSLCSHFKNNSALRTADA